jgi:hypothetical protein
VLLLVTAPGLRDLGVSRDHEQHNPGQGIAHRAASSLDRTQQASNRINAPIVQGRVLSRCLCLDIVANSAWVAMAAIGS